MLYSVWRDIIGSELITCVPLFCISNTESYTGDPDILVLTKCSGFLQHGRRSFITLQCIVSQGCISQLALG